MNDKFLFWLNTPATVDELRAKVNAMTNEEIAAELTNLALIGITVDRVGQELMGVLDQRMKLTNLPQENVVSC